MSKIIIFKPVLDTKKCPQILSVIGKKIELSHFFNNMAREDTKKGVSDFLHKDT